jgi:hypothetical protein
MEIGTRDKENMKNEKGKGTRDKGQGTRKTVKNELLKTKREKWNK